MTHRPMVHFDTGVEHNQTGLSKQPSHRPLLGRGGEDRCRDGLLPSGTGDHSGSEGRPVPYREVHEEREGENGLSSGELDLLLILHFNCNNGC